LQQAIISQCQQLNPDEFHAVMCELVKLDPCDLTKKIAIKNLMVDKVKKFVKQQQV